MSARTVADTIRAGARALGARLDHVPDDELGARLVAMPLEVAEHPAAAAVWMLHGCTAEQLTDAERERLPGAHPAEAGA